jgi:hypothetical protein
MAKTDLPELLSIEDIAIWLRKTPKAVRAMRARGQLPPAIEHSQLKCLRWRRIDLAQWFVQNESRARRSRSQ